MLPLKVISITNYFGSRQTKPAMNLSVSLTLTQNRTAYGDVTAGLAVSKYGSRLCNTLGQSSTSDPCSQYDSLPLACCYCVVILVPITSLNLSHFLGRQYLCIGRPPDKEIQTPICSNPGYHKSYNINMMAFSLIYFHISNDIACNMCTGSVTIQ